MHNRNYSCKIGAEGGKRMRTLSLYYVYVIVKIKPSFYNGYLCYNGFFRPKSYFKKKFKLKYKDFLEVYNIQYTIYILDFRYFK